MTCAPPASFPQVHLIKQCHSGLGDVVGHHVARLAVFNLGYLPRGDHALATQRETTLRALEAAMDVLQPGEGIK